MVPLRFESWTSQWHQPVRGVRANVFTLQVNHWANILLRLVILGDDTVCKWERYCHGIYHYEATLNSLSLMVSHGGELKPVLCEFIRIQVRPNSTKTKSEVTVHAFVQLLTLMKQIFHLKRKWEHLYWNPCSQDMIFARVKCSINNLGYHGWILAKTFDIVLTFTDTKVNLNTARH